LGIRLVDDLVGFFGIIFIVFSIAWMWAQTIKWSVMAIINLNDVNVWLQACEQQNSPIAKYNTMENLIIVGHWDILHYAIIQGGVYGVKFVIWVRRLHLLTIDNINYFRCDCKMCYFEYVEGIIFWCGWPNWPIFGCHLAWFIMYVVCNF